MIDFLDCPSVSSNFPSRVFLEWSVVKPNLQSSPWPIGKSVNATKRL